VFDNHKRGDHNPYVYRTGDRGRTWQPIAGNLPKWGSVHTIAEDHIDPNLLFVGTEFGLFYSQNRGRTWHQLKTNFPTIDVRDIEIQQRENDLVVGTFGRSIYVLDDYSPLRTIAATVASAEATLFPVRDPWLYVEGDLWGTWGGAKASNGDNFWQADNPPFGAVFTYNLSEGLQSRGQARRAAEREVEKTGGDTPYPSWDALRAEDREDDPAIVFTITDQAGKVVRRITGPHSKGLHRVAWDLRYEAPDPARVNRPAPGLFSSAPIGPMVTPGTYTVTLGKRVNGVVTPLASPQSFTVKSLENSPEIAQDREAVLAFQKETADLVRALTGANSASSEMRNRIAHLKVAVEALDTPNDGQRARIQQIETILDDADVALRGDRTIGGRNEPVPFSILQRIGQIRGWGWSHQSPTTGSDQSALELAKSEFATVLASLRDAENRLQALETELEGLGAPYTPGSGVPAWPQYGWRGPPSELGHLNWAIGM
ncbi:MAG: glycosyl hydrolase, partial [Pseudomonadota bacterium]